MGERAEGFFISVELKGHSHPEEPFQPEGSKEPGRKAFTTSRVKRIRKILSKNIPY